MKKLFFLVCLCASLTIVGQEKYFTKTGIVDFEASVPAFEAVKAKNSNVTALLNTESGELAALVLIKGFRFKNALMEEHFNENYMESDTHSKASFKGAIEGFRLAGFSKNEEQFHVKGTITIRGVAKEVSFNATMSKSADTIFLDGVFILSPGDFGIEIPGIVKEKIAKNITVTLDLEMLPRG